MNVNKPRLGSKLKPNEWKMARNVTKQEMMNKHSADNEERDKSDGAGINHLRVKATIKSA